MSNFATLDDITALWRPMSVEEQSRATALLPVVADSLRVEATKVGKDLDAMCSNTAYATVVKSIVADVIARTLMTSTNQEPMSQFSQTAGPYTASGTFLVPGGGLFIKRSELARLGLRRQRMGVINVYGTSARDDDHTV